MKLSDKYLFNSNPSCYSCKYIVLNSHVLTKSGYAHQLSKCIHPNVINYNYNWSGQIKKHCNGTWFEIDG